MKIFLFTLLASLAFVVACSSDSPEEKLFKQDWKAEYTEGCIIGGVANELIDYFDFCTCMADDMIENYSAEELMDEDFMLDIATPISFVRCGDLIHAKN